MDSTETETQLLPKGENEVTQSLRPNENEDELKAAVVNMFVMIFPKKSESLALFFGLFLLIMKKKTFPGLARQQVNWDNHRRIDIFDGLLSSSALWPWSTK